MRKTVNNVNIKGYVFSHHLTERVTGPNSKNPGQEFINGSMEVAINEQATATVRVNFSYVTPKFRNGNDNETYKLLKRIITSDDVYEKVGNRAIKVRVDAQFEPNVYKNRAGEIVCNTQIGASFVHELNPGEGLGMNPAKFAVDMVIGTAGEREFANGGSIFELRGYVFNWRQDLVPITFTVAGEDGRKYFEDQEYPMFTNLWGDIESEIVVSQKESTVVSAFGAPQVETTERQVMRWNVKGAAPEPYEYDDESGITKAEMKEKVLAHETYIAQQTERINNRNAAPSVYNAPKQTVQKKSVSVDDFDF